MKPLRRTELDGKDFSWECNECGSEEYSASVSAEDIENMNCGNCGGNEFHKGHSKTVNRTEYAIQMREKGSPPGEWRWVIRSEDEQKIRSYWKFNVGASEQTIHGYSEPIFIELRMIKIETTESELNPQE